MEQRGSITVFTGPMFSGKSFAMIGKLRSRQRAHKKVLILKPSLDNRFNSTDEIISKEEVAGKFEKSLSLPAYSITKGFQIGPLIKELDPDVLALDEAQFFDDSTAYILHKIAHNWFPIVGDTPINRQLEIYVAGLDLDAWQKPFGPMPLILAFADTVIKMTADCFKCGHPARFTQKFGGSEGQVEVGADDLYEARCELCYGSLKTQRHPG